MVQESGFSQEGAHLGDIVRAELFAIAHGQLEGRAFQMAQQDFEIIRVDVGVLRRTVEEIIGMLDDVLVERRAGGHQDGGGSASGGVRRGRRAATWMRWCPGYPAMTTASSEPISMPSSSALVATTARMSPSRSFCSISRRSRGR